MTLSTKLKALLLTVALTGCASAVEGSSQGNETAAPSNPELAQAATSTETGAAGTVAAPISAAEAGGAVRPRGPLPLRGVNLAGAEFGSRLPGVESIDYRWPTTSEVDYFLAQGMNTFRFGFKWERLQPTAYGELNESYLAKLAALVAYTTAKGAHVILNPHNFARYYERTVGSKEVPSAVFADLWKRLARHFGPNARVIFNLVNEPHDIGTEQWVSAANAAIQGIRSVGATNHIHVPGNGWTGAHAWTKGGYGTPNAVAMLAIEDPADNYAFEVHQYLDGDSGGKVGTCVSTTIGTERMANFIAWLREHGKRGFLGETAGGDNPTCNAAIEHLLGTLMDASDVIDGWLWWAAGPAWSPGYPFTLEPTLGGAERPQMAMLREYLFKP